jgi:hypothetical protein
MQVSAFEVPVMVHCMGKLRSEVIVKALVSLAEALAGIHAVGMVHRDVKVCAQPDLHRSQQLGVG